MKSRYRICPSKHFATGNHLKAARMFAGMQQSELASLASLHVNTVKRVEAMSEVRGSEHACRQIFAALASTGIATGVHPTPFIHRVESAS